MVRQITKDLKKMKEELLQNQIEKENRKIVLNAEEEQA